MFARRMMLGLAAGAFLAPLSQPAMAVYPDRPVTLIVAWAAGGGTDSVARTFAASAKLGIVPYLRFPMQPVDPREVGRVLAETAEAEPSLAPARRCSARTLENRHALRPRGRAPRIWGLWSRREAIRL